MKKLKYFLEQCLKEPQRAQYGGGIIANPEFTHTLEGWTVHGEGTIREGISKNGNRYIIAHGRTQSLDGASQTVQFVEGNLYTFSGKSLILYIYIIFTFCICN